LGRALVASAGPCRGGERFRANVAIHPDDPEERAEFEASEDRILLDWA
jgi:hypothetical protein